MILISAVIITKNAENIIADCIDSLSFCDEILVIDSGSTDRTVDIAHTLHAKIVHDDTESFAEHRNTGLKKAKGKWILYVDADERVTKELQEEIKQVIEEKNSTYSAYFLKRRNYYFGTHLWPQTEHMLRFFQKDRLQEWRGVLHETPVVSGTTGELEGFLDHYTHKNLTDMVIKTNQWSDLEADLRIQAHHPRMQTWRFFRVMLTAFYDSYVKQKGYKAGTVGVIESIYQSYSMFITYAKLWEKQQGSQK